MRGSSLFADGECGPSMVATQVAALTTSAIMPAARHPRTPQSVEIRLTDAPIRNYELWGQPISAIGAPQSV